MFQFLFVTLLCVLGATSTMASTPEGLAFLAANKDKEGVVTLPSGLQYKVLRSGPEGGLTPKVNSPCDCHYRGYLMDGVTEFDSSYKRGTTTKFAPNQVIKGWTEAMQLMKEGDKWQLFIPSELAYGERQQGRYITPGAVLLFDIEIVKVKSGGYVRETNGDL